MPMIVYKVCALDAWNAVQSAGFFHGSADDVRYGFIHLSTAAQLPGTLSKHFARIAGLLLLAFETESLGPGLQWEASASGQIYPHLYGPLPVAAARHAWPLRLDAAGLHVLPGDLA